MLDFDNEEKPDVEIKEPVEQVEAPVIEETETQSAVEEILESPETETLENSTEETSKEDEISVEEVEIPVEVGDAPVDAEASQEEAVEAQKAYDEYDYKAKYEKTYSKYNFGAHRENDKAGEYHTDKSYANYSHSEEQKWEGGTRSGGWMSFLRAFPFPMICVVIYLIVGFVCDAWHPAWIIFLTIPAYHSVVETYATTGHVRFPLFSIVIIAYLLMGFLGNLWHPGWLIFLAWPLYFVFFDLMKIKNSHIIIFTLLCIGIYVIIGVTINLWHPTWIIFLTIPIFESLYISATKLIKEKKEEKNSEQQK